MKMIQILCLEGVFDSAVHIVRDVIQTASRVAKERNCTNQLFVSTSTLNGKAVTTGSGQKIQPDGDAMKADSDIIILPGVSCENVASIEHYVRKKETIEAARLLTEKYQQGTQLATACTGVWIFAEAGILNGKKATTTWHFGTEFSTKYPKVDLQLGRMVTHDDGIWCAGAAMAHTDLALKIITACSGAEVSAHVASFLLLDNRPSQTHYMVADYLDEKSQDFQKLDEWVRKHLADQFSVLKWQLKSVCPSEAWLDALKRQPARRQHNSFKGSE